MILCSCPHFWTNLILCHSFRHCVCFTYIWLILCIFCIFVLTHLTRQSINEVTTLQNNNSLEIVNFVFLILRWPYFCSFFYHCEGITPYNTRPYFVLLYLPIHTDNLFMMLQHFKSIPASKLMILFLTCFVLILCNFFAILWAWHLNMIKIVHILCLWTYTSTKEASYEVSAV